MTTQKIEFKSNYAAANPIDKAGIVRGVSVLTAGIEAEGHGVYIDGKTLESVKACADKFGSVKMKADHGSGIFGIAGALSNFRIEGNHLRADMQLMRSHPHFGFLVELISTQAASVGLSIAFSMTREKVGEREYARCEDLYSVDLVNQPAANPSGLFSADSMPAPQSFGQAVGQVMMQRKVSKATAIELAVRDYPHLYTEWRKSGKTESLDATPAGATAQTFSALVAAQVAAGKSKAEAVAFCVNTFPAVYLQWRSGDTSKL